MGLLLPWSSCASFFEPDGSLRDLYVLGGGMASWEALFRIARTASTEFRVDGVLRPLPSSAREAHALRSTCSPLLSIDWMGILLNAHFFDEVDVELDLDPRAIDSSERFEELVRFMTILARETGRLVILTPENAPLLSFLEVGPTGERVLVQAHSDGSGRS